MTEPSLWSRNEFLIRRMHSASGLVPVGAFLCVHLATNASVLGGAKSFQEKVDLIHSLGPLLPLVEWVFIFLPILFHAVVGVAIVWGAMPNSTSYPLPKNIRYHLQRITGMIAFAFILYHVFHMHGWIKPLAVDVGGAQFDHHRATSTAADAVQVSLIIQLIYALGVIACVYHLAHGLWTAGITWGLWTSPAAQRRADRVCMAAGLLLCVVGLAALTGLVTTDSKKAAEIEQRLIDGKIASGQLDPAEVEPVKTPTDSAEGSETQPPPAEARSASSDPSDQVATDRVTSDSADSAGVDRTP